MATIIDLSDEPKFTIRVVASQTGILPVTLRAWERRHEILSPHRADNRYRLYSERDVAILRWLKNRVDDGVSISNAVSELRRMTKNNVWPEPIAIAPEPRTVTSETPPSQYARQLFQALIKHDEDQAGEILREAHALFDLLTLTTDVLIPVLHDIGNAWYRDEIGITTEHFASAYLRGKLLSLLQSYPSRRSAPFILVGCAPMEQHELGSLMLAVLLRSTGYRVEYLGPDIPIEDLADYARFEKPAVVILSATSEYSAREIKNMQRLLQKTRPAPVFGYGGRAFDTNPKLIDEILGVYLGNTLNKALDTVKTLLKTQQKASGKI